MSLILDKHRGEGVFFNNKFKQVLTLTNQANFRVYFMWIGRVGDDVTQLPYNIQILQNRFENRMALGTKHCKRPL